MAPDRMTFLSNSTALSKKRCRSVVITLSLAAGLFAGAALAQTPQPQTSQVPLSTEPAPVVQDAAPSTPTQVNPAPVEPTPAPVAPTQSDVAPVQPQPQPQAAPAAANDAPLQPTLADPQAAEAPATGTADARTDIPHNLSPWGMFMAADWVVKSVMIGLAVASLMTWTVWIAKTIELAGASIRAKSTLKIVHKSKTLAEATDALEKKGGPGALMLRMATHEMQLSDAVVEHTDGGGIKERVSSVLGRIETHAGRRMSRGTGVLATIGSVSPFVGLFGTVWGIMNSFISISESQTTNLAVVAPGIAEALLATAIGLVAAIPAVVIYNVFARSITGYRHLLADVAAGVERLVSRDLDFRRIPPGSSARPAVSLVGR
ncbi:tonB-system energizer ExbB [Agrobacterium sp. CG674]